MKHPVIWGKGWVENEVFHLIASTFLKHKYGSYVQTENILDKVAGDKNNNKIPPKMENKLNRKQTSHMLILKLIQEVICGQSQG